MPMKNNPDLIIFILALSFLNFSISFQANAGKPKGLKIAVQLSDSNLEEGTSVDSTPREWANELEKTMGKIWVDLYTADEYQFSKTENDLIEAVTVYHKMKKTEPELVPLRRKLLQKIDDLCQNHLKNPTLQASEKAKLELISQTAQNKDDYLEGVQHIREQTFKTIFRIQKPGVPLRAVTAGQLNRELLEHADPAVRGKTALLPYFKKWTSAIEAGSKVPDFFFWLEGEKLPLNKSMKSEDEEESSTATRLVSFDKDGHASSTFYMTRPKGTYTSSELDLHNKDYTDPITHSVLRDTHDTGEQTGRIHYAMSETGDLYIRYKSPYHSYVIRGKNVISAGFIRFKDRRIDELDNDSGHYSPPDNRLDFAKKLLIEKHGDKIFSDTFVLQYFDSRRRVPRGEEQFKLIQSNSADSVAHTPDDNE